jgi:hypothetical protein
VEGPVSALALPLSAEQQTWLFRLRQRIVRELVTQVSLRPDGTGEILLHGDSHPLPLQVPVLPPKKKAKSS